MTQLGGLTLPGVTLGEGVMLVSVWKPIVLLLPIVGWAWVVSGVLDKHAFRFHLGRKQWNVAHIAAAVVAVGVALAIPMKGEGAFWVGLLAMIVILAADIVVFAAIANKDERVPAEHHLKLDFSKLGEAKQAKAAAKQAGQSELIITGPDKQTIVVPDKDTPEFAVRVAAEALVLRATTLRASQVDLGPTGRDNAYAVSLLLDGVRHPGDTMPGADAARVINFWKGAAKLDVADTRRKLQGDANIDIHGQKRTARVITSGSQAGMRLTLLFDPDKAVRRKYEDLGLLDNQLEMIRELVAKQEGVVLVAAPPDAGRTTLLYSILKLHDAYTANIQTLELDIEDALEGVRQNKARIEEGAPDFATQLRSILRRDPDAVAVADVPDAQTAIEAAKSDIKHTRVYLSLPVDGGLAAIQTYVRAVGDPNLAGESLRGVIAGKLVRKLCVNCRVAYPPAPDQLKALGLPADRVKQLYKKGGQVLIKNKPEVCPVCNGIGYIGQEGVFEVYPLGAEERALIKKGDFAGLQVELRKKQLPSISQSAKRKLVDGLTSIEELQRISTSAKPAATAPKQPAPAKQPTA